MRTRKVISARRATVSRSIERALAGMRVALVARMEITMGSWTRLRRAQETLKILEERVDKSPSDAALRRQLGRLLMDLGRHDEAAMHLWLADEFQNELPPIQDGA